MILASRQAMSARAANSSLVPKSDFPQMALKLFHKGIPSIHGAALLIGGAGLLSRLLGMLRDRMLAGQFGASRTLDVYYASFQIPDFLFTIFLLGAASAAIIPLFVQYSASDPMRARRFIGGLLLLFAVAAVLVSGIVIIFGPFLARFIAPGFSLAAKALLIYMTRIMMLSPILLGLSSILSAVMQANRQFFVFALTSVLYNLGIIAGILLFVPMFGPLGLALGVILGAFMHFLVQVPALWQIGFFPILSLRQGFADIRFIMKLSLPRVFAITAQQIMMIILVSLGSLLAAGSITIFQFANNLRYLPIGIIGVSYAIAVFPKLTEAALEKSHEQFFANLVSTIETILFWVAPIAAMTIVLRALLVRLALGVHQFSWSDTRLTAAVLAIFAIAMVSESLTPVFIRAFYAVGNTRLPFIVSLCSVGFVVVSAPLLVSLFTSGRASGHLIASILKIGDLNAAGVLGLAIAFVLGSLIDTTLLGLALVFELRKYFGKEFRNGFLLASARTILATIAAAGFGYGILYIVAPHISLSTFIGVLSQTVIVVVSAGAFYVALTYLMGGEEAISVWTAIRQRAFRLGTLPAEIDEDRDNIPV